MAIKRALDKQDVVHIYNGILLSHEKNETMPFVARRVDLEIVILSDINQRKTNVVISLICGT